MREKGKRRECERRDMRGRERGERGRREKLKEEGNTLELLNTRRNI